MRKKDESAIAALEELGFTSLEARVYVELLRSGPQTGYGIAQLVGKAAANSYKALESLAARGAAVCDDAGARLYRAVPYRELSAMLSADFTRRAREADNALATLDRRDADERIYRLNRPDQVLERARAIVSRAREVLYLDAFPDALEALRDALEAAARRGVAVVVHAYAPVVIDGVRVVETPRGASVRGRWPGTWLNVSCDAAEALVAHLLDDDAAVGLWTANPYLAWVFYSGISCESALAELEERAAREPNVTLAAGLQSIAPMFAVDPPGRSTLLHEISKKKVDPR